MKNLNFLWLFILAMAFGACYQKNPPRTTDSAKLSENPSPTAETTVKIPVQTANGDYNAAINHFNAKQYDRAATELEAVVSSDEKNQPAYLYLARSYQSLNKKDEAINSYQKAIQLKPDDAEANYELGKVYIAGKNYQAALPFIEKAAKIKYTSTEYLIALGDAYRELKKCDYAMVPYGKVTGFDDKNTAAYYGMGLCYIELKNRIAAGQQVRNLEKLDKDLAKKLADKIPQ